MQTIGSDVHRLPEYCGVVFKLHMTLLNINTH